jgi:hypothetical protein
LQLPHERKSLREVDLVNCCENREALREWIRVNCCENANRCEWVANACDALQGIG